MMDRNDFLIDAPDATKIWRFLDFTKFVDLLEHRSLFFCRADRLGDQFEGSFTRHEKLNHEFMDTMEEYKVAPGEITVSDFYSKAGRWLRQWILVNSWHMNECESAAMWRLYTQTNQSIAVESTVGRLKSSITQPGTYYTQMEYLDYTNDSPRVHNPYARKLRSFAHENEFRALRLALPTRLENGTPYLDLWRENQSSGEYVSARLETLVVRVYVSPGSPDWFFELTAAVTKRYGLAVAVQRSSLDSEALF